MGKKLELIKKMKEEMYHMEIHYTDEIAMLKDLLDNANKVNNMDQPLEDRMHISGGKAHGSSGKIVSATNTVGSKNIEDTSWGLSNGLFSNVLSTAKDVRYKAYSVRDMAIQKADSLTGGEGADLVEEREPPNSFMTDLLYTLLDARDALDRANDRLDNV